MQLGAVATTLVYSGVGSFIILKIIDMAIGLRVTEERSAKASMSVSTAKVSSSVNLPLARQGVRGCLR